MDIKVRPLVVDDVFTVASMLSKITKIGKTKDEFVAMPAITVIGVVEALAKHEDILDFFAQASRLTLKKEAQA